jgi:short-subunit dehydrogenase
MHPPAFRCAYITGGSSGIGFAIALEAVQRGTDVLLIARNTERLKEAVHKLKEKSTNPVRIDYLSLDVGNPEEIRQRLGSALTDFGEPDLLVNCAGESFPEYFEKIPDSVFEQLVNVHVKGTWYVTRELVPSLRKLKGTIVNVSSIAGLVGVFGYTAYSAVKAAVIGFSEALRSELVPEGMRVSVLCPPDTDTPGFERENRSKPPETRVISSNAGVLKPDQVARELFRGLGKGKFLIIPGYKAKITAWVIRHWPGIVRRVMDRAVWNYKKHIP